MFFLWKRISLVRFFLIVILLVIVSRLNFICIECHDRMSKLAVSQRPIDMKID